MAFTFVARLNRAKRSSVGFIGSGANAGETLAAMSPYYGSTSFWRTSRVVPAGFDNPNNFNWWIARPLLFLQSLAAIVIGIPTLTLLPNKILGAINTGIAALTTLSLFKRVLDAINAGIAALTTRALFKRVLAAINTGIAVLSTLLIPGAVARTASRLLRLGVR